MSNKYHEEKYILQWLLCDPSKQVRDTVHEDERLVIFEKHWKKYNTKRGTRRFLAKEKVTNIVSNLVLSLLSYDKAIKDINHNINEFWRPINPIATPLKFSKYRILHPPQEKTDDYQVRLFLDLLKESKQNGTRGQQAKRKLKNLVYHLFYLVSCKKDTYIWQKRLLNSS